MNNLKLYALGGLDENGKNLYCVEIDEAIYIVNCGIKRTDISQFGIDYVTCRGDELHMRFSMAADIDLVRVLTAGKGFPKCLRVKGGNRSNSRHGGENNALHTQ